MRFSIYCVIVVSLLASFACLGADRARADQFPQMKMVHCPHFTASPFVMPGKSGKSGNTYGIGITNDTTSCAQATSWAKKLMAGGSPAGAMLPFEVHGAPPGFKCYITPDTNGHAIGGSCHKLDNNGKLIGSWDWLALPND